MLPSRPVMTTHNLTGDLVTNSQRLIPKLMLILLVSLRITCSVNRLNYLPMIWFEYYKMGFLPTPSKKQRVILYCCNFHISLYLHMSSSYTKLGQWEVGRSVILYPFESWASYVRTQLAMPVFQFISISDSRFN